MKAVLALAGIAAFLGAPLANATLEVRIIDSGTGGADTGWLQCTGGSSVTAINAGGVVGALVCSATGAAFTGAVGNYNVASNTTSRSDPGNPFLDMSYSASTNSSVSANPDHPGDLIIESMGDTYTANGVSYRLVGNGNGTYTSSSVTVAAYGGNTNNICAAGINACTPPSAAPAATQITQTFTALTTPNSYAVDMASLTGNTVNPYSLGLSYSISAPVGANGGSLSGDLQLDAVPEPAAVTLFGGVLLFTVTAIRRKARRTA